MQRSRGWYAFNIFNICFLAILGFTSLYPFLNTIALSLSDAASINAGRVYLIPRGVHFKSFEIILNDSRYLQALRNTIWVTVIGTCFSILMTCLGAYPLSRKRLPGRSFFMIVIVFTMFFGGGYVPTYLLMRSLKLLDTLWVLVIPSAVATWNLIILRNFFQAIPESLEEAAKLDGANDLLILIRIVIPLSVPAIATIGLFYAVGYWNQFFNALIYITDTSKQVLQVYLSEFVLDSSVAEVDISLIEELKERLKLIPESVKAATIVSTIGPILVVYPWIQKYFVKGVMIGSLKG